MTRFKNETQESEQETLKGQEKANKVAEGRGESSSEPKEKAGRKSAQTKIPKAEKKPPEGSSKTKSTEEEVNSEPKVPKMATRSSSQLKLVPEKIKNYFSEQDNEYFSSEEADDVFVSGKFRKK